MTKPTETHVAPSAAAMRHGGHRLPSPARYRRPGDMIRLIIAGLVLAGALDAQVVLAGRRPRSVAEDWPRAQGLMQTGGVVR